MLVRPGAIALLALAVGCGPFVVFPGGGLEGNTASPPASWAFDEINTVQLETRPEDPYSVNIWAVGIGPNAYVHSGTNRSNWVEHMESDGRVRLRIEGQIYELQAARVEDQDEFDRFSDAYEETYGSRPRNENAADAYLFRLSAR